VKTPRGGVGVKSNTTSPKVPWQFNKGFTPFPQSAIMNAATINGINKKGGERMVQEVSDKELITITIDRYTDLQQIKKANGDHKNEMLDYFIKVTVAKLSSLGVNVEDITL